MKFKLPGSYLPDKLKELKRYTTKQEKEALLEEDETPSSILKALSGLEAMNTLEASAMIFRLRDISVSDLYSGIIECPKCKAMNQFNIEGSDIISFDNVNTEIPIGLFEQLSDFIQKKDLDKLILKDYIRYEEIMEENNSSILNLSPESTCRSCGFSIPVHLSPIEIFSKLTLSQLYQEIFLFGFYLHYSAEDVEHLYPFERDIIAKLLKKKIET